MPKLQQGIVSVFSSVGQGTEASRLQEESLPTTTHSFFFFLYLFIQSNAHAKLHTPLASPPPPGLQLVSKVIAEEGI